MTCSSRGRKAVVCPVGTRGDGYKAAELILTWDLNPILSQVPEATN